MSLWDNITQKAAAVTDKAVHQAKNFTEQVKLRNQISEAQSTITDCYTQIGKQYAAAHSEDFDEAYAPMMAAIAGANRQIASLQEQLRDLKKVALCPKCGAEVSKDASYCGACGAEMPKPAPVEAEVVTDDAPAKEAPVADAPAETASAAEAPGEAASAEEAPSKDAPEYI